MACCALPGEGDKRVAGEHVRDPNTQNGIFAELKLQCALLIRAFDASLFISDQPTCDASNSRMRL
jgi:hypothetical protein